MSHSGGTLAGKGGRAGKACEISSPRDNMAWISAEFHFDDGAVLYGLFYSSVGVLMPLMFHSEEEAYEFDSSLDAASECDCDGERCRVVIRIDGRLSWQGRACRRHLIFFGPLDMEDDAANQAPSE